MVLSVLMSAPVASLRHRGRVLCQRDCRRGERPVIRVWSRVQRIVQPPEHNKFVKKLTQKQFA